MSQIPLERACETEERNISDSKNFSATWFLTPFRTESSEHTVDGLTAPTLALVEQMRNEVAEKKRETDIDGPDDIPIEICQ
jgi:hypothetical protein